MSSLDRVRTYFGLGRRAEDGAPEPPRDVRTPLQVAIGAIFGGLVAGLLAALVGSDTPAALTFGFLMGLLFLYLDLRARRAQGPPGD